jgi:hypothetical protein
VRRAASELSTQSWVSALPWARYSRAWARQSSLSASLATRASTVRPASYSATTARTSERSASGMAAVWAPVTSAGAVVVT